MTVTEHEHEFVWSGAEGRCECGANVWVIQEVLDAAAEDARKVAGDAHYTGCRVRNESENVELWLFDAPLPVLQELEAARPGVYVIHNDAPRPYAAVLELMDTLKVEFQTLRAEGINVVGWGPTQDGYLHVEVMGDVPTAQARLDTMFGSNVAQVEYGEPGIAC
jgi:hypothetical protein